MIDIRERIGVWPADRLKISGLYFFLFCGGLWHLLGVFQTVMAVTAGPLLIGLASWLVVETLRQPEVAGERTFRRTFLEWSALVVVSTFFLEWLGVISGVVFGSYQYGEVLRPQLAGVPLAIGFAWLGMLLASSAVIQRFRPSIVRRAPIVQALAIAVVMVLFDAVMEPVAMALDYWQWEGGVVPLHNYAGWFVISLALSWIAIRRRLLLATPLPALAAHAFWAQLLYFVMITVK